MDKTASFRFVGALNDFLPKAQKEKAIRYSFGGTPAVKDAIEALGVPHPAVAVIVINKKPVAFNYWLQAEDTVEVYPQEYPTKWPQAPKLRVELPQPPAFILDVHLGKLAKSLRLLGFNTIYENNYDDQTIADRAAAENRVVLTRDIGLLKLRIVQWGYWLRSQNSEKQLAEVLAHYNLFNKVQPFTRCLMCNGLLLNVPKEAVLTQLPPKTKIYFQEFHQCQTCRRVFWKGSHYERMEQYVQQLHLPETDR
ncbi:Mut7-C RNAse domain-containing protein [Adhaeribacter pallidiroseus]|uniref:Twitching motility protein PilT n=1 Tax=Adhaeribacter pallidiroseus TaxID=2072847 RepID=A0A369QNI5_9BACT|nr:Mut7-C RNAse domain-containing protein [Adhaeribacter pallidiroseus]RDC66304.1 hypothetical protein AHMF7616_04935 [Adhaeribacter pallidiroseus]